MAKPENALPTENRNRLSRPGTPVNRNRGEKVHQWSQQAPGRRFQPKLGHSRFGRQDSNDTNTPRTRAAAGRRLRRDGRLRFRHQMPRISAVGPLRRPPEARKGNFPIPEGSRPLTATISTTETSAARLRGAQINLTTTPATEIRKR